MDVKLYYTAQSAVLGSLLISPDKLTGMIMAGARAEDFSDAALRHLFESARALFMADRPIDPVTLLDKAGAAYEPTVRQALESTPTAANIKEYLELLRSSAMFAKLQAAAMTVLNAPDLQTATDALTEAEQLLVDRPSVSITSFSEGLGAFLDRVQSGKRPEYLKWGLLPLDTRLSVEPGDVILLGADSSVGKTALALQLAHSMAKSGKRVGIFSLETRQKKVYDRMFAQIGRIELDAIKHGGVQSEDIRRLLHTVGNPDELRLDVIDAAGMTAADIRALTLARRYEVIFVDYVQIVQSSLPSKTERPAVVTAISMALHTMAQSLGVTVIELSQLTPPDIKKDRYRLNHKEDLRESRQLINDADFILIMSRTDPTNVNYRDLLIDKNKDGPLGKIPLDFYPQHMRFVPHLQSLNTAYDAELPRRKGVTDGQLGMDDNPFEGGDR